MNVLASMSDDGTAVSNASRGKSVSQQSTPDMTHTNNNNHQDDDVVTTTLVPNVPDDAMASSPDHRGSGGSSQGLPHPFVDDYSAFEGGGSGGAVSETRVETVAVYRNGITPPRRVSTDGGAGLDSTQASSSSYGGNPFIPSDDERKQARRVKASTPPVNNRQQGSSPYGDFGTPAQYDNAFQHHDDEEDAIDPFRQGPSLEKKATALQQDPFNDDTYYRTLAEEHRANELDATATPPPQEEDPFAHFGNGGMSYDPLGGRNGGPNDDGALDLRNNSTSSNSLMVRNKSGSISVVRRTSQFGPEAQRQQERVVTNQKPRRQSVGLALAQAKPKEKASEIAGGHIDVVSTVPTATSNTNDNRKSVVADYSAEDKASIDKASEQLFMPSMKREQYIPVRVAREKIKQILSEMAQMKLMHLSAIDTMEKQHQFLKAQLETACAAYCRKLTADYNNRVVALNEGYKRRLVAQGIGSTGGVGGMSGDSPGSRGAYSAGGSSQPPPLPTLAPSATPPQSPSPSNELVNLRASVQSLGQELSAKQSELDRAVRQTHECLERAEEAEEQLQQARESMRRMQLDIDALRQEAAAAAAITNEASKPENMYEQQGTALHQAEKIEALELELAALRDQSQKDAADSHTDITQLKSDNVRLTERIQELERQAAVAEAAAVEAQAQRAVANAATPPPQVVSPPPANDVYSEMDF